MMMKRLLGIMLTLAVIGITITDAQVGSNTPFAAPPSPSGEQAQSAFGGGGINPNDIDPPPDPIDTPIDAGVIYLLIIGTAYGVTRMKKSKLMII
jgi:hypothetical protein